MIEYRVCWNASSNISFEGKSDWSEWDGFEETVEEAENALYGSLADNPINLPYGLELALERSGFEYWVEVREV